MRVDNAVIMAAGTASRFVPLSHEMHKSLIEVKGEILIERQIKQLQEAGITDIYIIVGYKAEQLLYLEKKFNVRLLYNSEYLSRNNNSSIWAARDVIRNTYICTADSYFAENPFHTEEKDAFYSGVYANTHTDEWCMTVDKEGNINHVFIGGENAWYMFGPAFWSEAFGKEFLAILENEYHLPETANKYWEDIFINHLDRLKMKIKKYEPGFLYEFDTLDELRAFDRSYVTDTRSTILKRIAASLGIDEADISNIQKRNNDITAADGFLFDCPSGSYEYIFEEQKLNKKG